MNAGTKMMLLRSNRDNNREYPRRSGTYRGNDNYPYNLVVLPRYPITDMYDDRRRRPEEYTVRNTYTEYDPTEEYYEDRPHQMGFEIPRMHYDKSSNDSAGSSKINNIYMNAKNEPKKLTREAAIEWVEEMENADGTTGPHFSMEQTKAIQEKMGAKISSVEFFAAMNMMYSDYCKVAKKFNMDIPDFYACLAHAFLNDQDAVPDKLAAYHCYIVK